MSIPSDTRSLEEINAEASRVGSARFRLVPNPTAIPGQCAICGTPNHDDGFIDPQMDFEGYGAIFFCATCAGSLVERLGWISPHKAVELISQNKNIRQAFEEVSSQIMFLGELDDFVRDYINRHPDSFADSLVNRVLSDDKIDEQELLEVIRNSESSDEQDTGSTDDITEPIIVERSDDVSSVTSDANQLLNELGL